MRKVRITSEEILNTPTNSDTIIVTTEELASPVCSIPDIAYDVRPHPDWPGFFIYKIDTKKSKYEL